MAGSHLPVMRGRHSSTVLPSIVMPAQRVSSGCSSVVIVPTAASMFTNSSLTSAANASAYAKKSMRFASTGRFWFRCSTTVCSTRLRISTRAASGSRSSSAMYGTIDRPCCTRTSENAASANTA